MARRLSSAAMGLALTGTARRVGGARRVQGQQSPDQIPEERSMGFALSRLHLTSPAFSDGEAIPRRHAGDGEDLSPPLRWSEVPQPTQGLALVCHDPDAPLILPGTYGFVHWVLYNLPGTLRELPEGSDEGTCGLNNFDQQAYGGPMPPEGHGTHRYFFWLFALDEATDFPAGLTMWELLGKIEPHVLGMNRLMGTYRRD
jgi:Raf kinase inhibitor-like YbhB/YbcL family protein